MKKQTDDTRMHWAGRSALLLGAGLMLGGCIPEPEQIELPPALVPAIRIADANALTERDLPGHAPAGPAR